MNEQQMLDFREAQGFEPDDYKIPLAIYLHVNQFTTFQAEVLKLVLEENTTIPRLEAAHILINKEISKLVEANWSPERHNGDMVTRPQHYDRFPIEPTFFNRENGIDWNRGNANKYLCRFPYKNGIQDLEKARRYILMEVRYLQGMDGWSK